MSEPVETVKIKHGEGDYAIIRREDFDAQTMELFVEPENLPKTDKQLPKK